MCEGGRGGCEGTWIFVVLGGVFYASARHGTQIFNPCLTDGTVLRGFQYADFNARSVGKNGASEGVCTTF